MSSSGIAEGKDREGLERSRMQRHGHLVRVEPTLTDKFEAGLRRAGLELTDEGWVRPRRTGWHRHTAAFRKLSEFDPDRTPMNYCPICGKVPEDNCFLARDPERVEIKHYLPAVAQAALAYVEKLRRERLLDQAVRNVTNRESIHLAYFDQRPDRLMASRYRLGMLPELIRREFRRLDIEAHAGQRAEARVRSSTSGPTSES